MNTTTATRKTRNAEHGTRNSIIESTRRLFLCAAALSVLVSAGCKSGVIRRRVERRIERRLAGALGPADEYRVRILDTNDSDLVQGRARRVEVSGRKILAKHQFLIDSIRLTLTDLRYEDGEEDYVSVARSDLQVEFAESAVNQSLQAYLSRYEPEVRFEPDRVRVRLTYPFLGVPSTVRAAGRLRIEEGRRLLFEADEAEVSFISQPGLAKRFVEDRVNPLLDLSRIDFPARLESVRILQGRLEARGTASLRREL